MQSSDMTVQRMVVIVLLGGVLFNYPVLSLFSRPASWLGFPVLYLYVFGAWALVIALAAYVIERRA